MKSENLVLAGLLALVILGGSFLARPSINVEPSDVVVQTIPQEEFGAIPGNSVEGETFTVNGVTTYHYSCEFKNFATSTACSIRIPQASTTPEYVGVRFIQNTGATAIHVGVGATRWATTTSLLSLSGTASKKIAGVASTTLNNSSFEDNIMPFGRYINVSIEGGTSHTATGTVKIILRAL